MAGLDTVESFSSFLQPNGVTPEVTRVQSSLPLQPVKGSLNSTSDFGSFISNNSPLTREQVIADPEKMKTIRDMMAYDSDPSYANAPDPRNPSRTDVKSDEETYDTFITKMRYFNTNEVSTVREAINVFGADDANKQKYGKAYQLYDQIGNVASSEGALGTAKAAYDYTLAIATSPSTWAGFIVGKILGKVETGVVKEGIKDAIKLSTEGVVKELAAKGASQATQKVAKKEIVRAAAKISAKRATLVALGLEAPASFLQDKLYQDTLIESGAKDSFSVAESIISTAFGASSAVTSLLAHGVTKGATGLEGASDLITVEKKARKSAANKKVAAQIKQSAVQANIDWIKMAEAGKSFEEDVPLRKAVFSWFTDINRPDGLIGIIKDAGVKLDKEDAGGTSKALAAFAEGMDDESRKIIDEAFSPAGVTLSQVTDIFASMARGTGQDFKSLSSVDKFLEGFKSVSVANHSAAENIAANVAQAGQVDKQSLKYFQSVWKRAIVSNIATSMANVKGWGVMQAIKFPSQALQMAALGAKGILTNDKKSLGQANALLKNLGYMTKIAVDPYTTVEAFAALVEAAPKRVQKEVAHHFFQGVELKNGAAALGMNPEGFAVKNTEKLLSFAQHYSLVHAQDVLTKAISGTSELDKQVRLRFGIGLDELLKSGRTDEITDEIWNKATRVLQDDTFSTDFSKSTGLLSGLAKASQNVSQDALGGFLWPFGQFVNSMLAFSYKHSPLGLFEPAFKIIKGKGDMDAGERLSRAVIGSTALGMAFFRERDKQQEGLQWNEERDDTGAVYKVDNLFPIGLTNLIGRIAWNAAKGEGQDPDLWQRDLAQQLAVPAAIGNLSSWDFIKDFGDYLNQEKQSGSDTSIVIDLTMLAASAIGNIGAGLTRPLDPLNDAVGALMDYDNKLVSTAQVDNKQSSNLESVIHNLTRYTNNFFNLAFGTPDETGRRLYGKEKHSATHSGPIKTGNPAAATLGVQYEQPRNSINTLLGMVDKPPFKVDSFSSGNAEYDDFINTNVFPILERKASALLSNPNFQQASQSAKMDLVDSIISDAKQEVLSDLESGAVGGEPEVLLNERRKLLARSKSEVIRAKNALGITAELNQLSITEIEAIKNQMEWSKELDSEVEDY